MSKKNNTIRVAELSSALTVERAKRIAAENVIESHDAEMRARATAATAAAAAPPPAPAAPPPDPNLVRYKELKASKDPYDALRAQQLIAENPYLAINAMEDYRATRR